MSGSGDLVTRVFQLWTDLPEDDAAAVAAFGELYADPVTVNGVPMPLVRMVARARATAAAIEGLEAEILSVVSSEGRTAVAFRMHGRHVGPLDTPLGPVPGNGERVSLQVIDVLEVHDGRIERLWMTADLLGTLAQAGAVRLAVD